MNIHSIGRDSLRQAGGVLLRALEPPGTVSQQYIDEIEERQYRLGYGACAKAGCNCRIYEGGDSTCGNCGCGHTFGEHW